VLGIRRVEHLAMRLGVPRRRLERIADDAPHYYEELELVDPAKNKVREVLNVRGPLRMLQDRLHRRILAPARRPSKYSHGGIHGRNIKTNAACHARAAFVHVTDIADFYPSVHSSAIYRLFTNKFDCSPDVGRICTKLCTRDKQMPLGLLTSPILADCLMAPVDHRIGRMCELQDLAYSRFVDDVAVSGRYPIDSGAACELIKKILKEYGFCTRPEKVHTERMSPKTAIAKLYYRRGRLDVTPEYLALVRSQIETASALSRGCEITAPYYTANQILGRVHFIAWVNSGRKRELLCAFRTIDWEAVEREAASRGLVAFKKQLVKKAEFERRPTCAIPVPVFNPD
jgi:RNA-directed DNA polymerase